MAVVSVWCPALLDQWRALQSNHNFTTCMRIGAWCVTETSRFLAKN